MAKVTQNVVMQGSHCRAEDAKKMCTCTNTGENVWKHLGKSAGKKLPQTVLTLFIDDDSPMLRSSSVQNISGRDENYIVNLQLLREGLRRCNLCGEGPYSLDDISKEPMRIGLCVVLYLKCRNCKEESSIKTYDSHRTGKRGPEAVTLNTTPQHRLMIAEKIILVPQNLWSPKLLLCASMMRQIMA